MSMRSMFLAAAALAEFLGFPIPAALHEAILTTRGLYEPRVFLVRLFDFIQKSDARQISLEDSRGFEAVLEVVYRRYGFVVQDVQPADIDTRIGKILAQI